MLRGAAESVLREKAAGRTFDNLLTVDRAAFQQEVLERLRERCTSYGAHGLGVRLDGVSLHDLHPPQEVVAAYHSVTRAMEARDRRVNDAKAQAVSNENAQLAATRRDIRVATAERDAKVRLVRAQRDALLARLDARKETPELTDFRLYWDALAEALTGRDKVLLDTDKIPARRNLWLMPFESLRMPFGARAQPQEP